MKNQYLKDCELSVSFPVWNRGQWVCKSCSILFAFLYINLRAKQVLYHYATPVSQDKYILKVHEVYKSDTLDGASKANIIRIKHQGFSNI